MYINFSINEIKNYFFLLLSLLIFLIINDPRPHIPIFTQKNKSFILPSPNKTKLAIKTTIKTIDITFNIFINISKKLKKLNVLIYRTYSETSFGSDA